jgi:predicted metal-dependent phosphoesterase TrpH
MLLYHKFAQAGLSSAAAQGIIKLMSMQVQHDAPARFPVDLHTHTSASDGSDTPAELVAEARRRGVVVLGITDHDSVAGLDAALDAGRAQGIEIVPGVELSIANQPERDFMELHLLGYGIDHHEPALVAALRRAAEARLEQKLASVRKLQSLGFDVPEAEVLALAGAGVLGRAHIAQVALARNPGRFRDAEQIFREYISPGGLAYVPRAYQIVLEEGIQLILQAGGAPVLAHPASYRQVRQPAAMVRRAAALGIAGLESRYPYDKTRPHFGAGASEPADLISYYSDLGRSLGLGMTGGSDYHGRRKNVALGEQGLTLEEYAAWREYAGAVRRPRSRRE